MDRYILGFPPEDFFSGDYFSGAVDVSVFVRIFLYDIVIEEKRLSKAYGSENKAAGMDWEAQLADLSSAISLLYCWDWKHSGA